MAQLWSACVVWFLVTRFLHLSRHICLASWRFDMLIKTQSFRFAR